MAFDAIWKFGRFFIAAYFILGAIILQIFSSPWLSTYGLVGSGLIILSELFLPTNEGIVHYDKPKILRPIQCARQIIDIFAVLMFACIVGLPSGDLLGLSAVIDFISGYDMYVADTSATHAGKLSLFVAFAFAVAVAMQDRIAMRHERSLRLDNSLAA